MRNALLALAAVALVAFTPGRAAADTEHVTRRVAAEPGGALHLKNFSGRVTITAFDGAEVIVDAVRHATRDRLDRITLDVHKDGSTVVVEANHRDRSWDDRHDNVVETDFDIKVPRRTNLDVQVFSSPVDITGVEGSYKVHAFSARVRLNDVIWQDRQTIDVNTFSGSVDVQLPAVAAGSVSFDSFSGDLKSDLPLTLRGSGRRSFSAELGSGGNGRLHVKTFSGDVRITR